jgi:subtilisin-like proprotein convertase family protein
MPLLFSNNQVYPIPENNVSGVASPITVSGINGLTLNSNSIVKVKINLTHTYDGDLAISLISPSGNSTLLSNRRGNGGDNFVNTEFSMSASTLISAGSAPFTGTYKPDGNFASLTGNANGTWFLYVQDLAAQDVGSIQNWSITINNDVPETFSYAWSSNPPGFSSTISNPVANPNANTVYTSVVTSNATGCSRTQSVAVSVSPSVLYYADNDHDGYGNSASSQQLCAPSGIFTSLSAGDCDDNNNAVHPGAVEICGNSVDDNCNTQVDEGCSNVSLNVKMFIEAFYIGSGKMAPVLFNSNVTTNINLCDTVTVELYNSFYPFAKVASVKTLLDVNGNATASFLPSILNAEYYIAIRHRNVIETWSKNPVLFNTPSKSIDFTR